MSPRVLILNYEYPPLGGGAANALYYLLREFAASSEIRVDLVTSSSDGRFAITELAGNVSIHKLAIRKANRHYWTQPEILDYSVRAALYARRLVDRTDYDLCHAFFAIPCGVIAYGLRGRLPYIVSLRGSDVPGFNNRFNWMNAALKPAFRRVLKSASAVQANSEGLMKLAHLTSSDTPIDIIHNGVDCRQFSPAEHRNPVGRSKLENAAARLISVSRLIGRKGIDDLIRALPAIKESLGPVELTVVGEGNLKDSLSALAESEGVGRDVTWLGAVDHDGLPDIYRRSDLFVLPSHFEGMSNALLEAMASGLPVVVTATGGTDELIDGNGLIVSAGDSGALGRAIIDILGDDDKRRAYGAGSREIASRFSWGNVARQYLKTYEQVIGKSIPVEVES
ncbi:MAG: glycosyltransferase family 4 protein [Actinomycetota bacterium]|nr:glycosyltransferase family 4 protein [Actinomycetota bacterium]